MPKVHNGQRRWKILGAKYKKTLLFQKSAISGPVLYGPHQVPHIKWKLGLVRLIWRTRSWFYENGFWDIDSRSWLVGIPTTLLWQLLEPTGCIFQGFSPSNILKPRSWRFQNGAACHINAYSYAFYSHLKSKNGFSGNLTFGDLNFDKSCFWGCRRQKLGWEWSQWPYIFMILPHEDILKVSGVKNFFQKFLSELPWMTWYVFIFIKCIFYFKPNIC